MLTGASARPNADFSTALPQPMFGLKTKIQAMAISSPGIAKESSDSVWNSAPPGASVRSTTHATSAPMTKVVSAVAAAKIREFRNRRRICQLE
jgi:hypothetical protein